MKNNKKFICNNFAENSCVMKSPSEFQITPPQPAIKPSWFTHYHNLTQPTQCKGLSFRGEWAFFNSTNSCILLLTLFTISLIESVCFQKQTFLVHQWYMSCIMHKLIFIIRSIIHIIRSYFLFCVCIPHASYQVSNSLPNCLCTTPS
jgi:hypothetical protein